ncbi:MAG: MBOAT family protein [Elusimicrobia bacterium]|nr:MBOAT family protein [Elusimicrobiota bacterium]
MLFNTFEFLVFFTVVVALYYTFAFRFRWVLLLVASYYFYMAWEPAYIILIIISTLIDYFAGLKMDQVTEKTKRRKYLILSIVTNLALLFTFKYYNFFAGTINRLFGHCLISYTLPESGLLLPIGISFYTFQTMAYSFDIYRGEIRHEKHLGIYALYVAYFPQLVAGPIERAGNLIKQLKVKHEFDYYRVTGGLKLMLWGMFKKVVIADRLALFVDKVYADPTGYKGISLIIATVFFAFQIYCDFSGYSDIAIGAAEVMGVRLMQNFRRPYHAQSIGEFWKRWHISLSTWFRDYFYISIGGNRVPVMRWHFNIFITFLVSGLWHGASWTFVVWGALHGFYMIFANLTKNIREKIVSILGLIKFPNIMRFLRVCTTFLLVCFAWIFFRANTFSDAKYIVANLFSGIPDVFSKLNDSGFIKEFVYFGQSGREFNIAVIAIILLEIVHLIQCRGSIREMISRKPLWIRWSIYVIAVLVIMNFGITEKIPFIYFQF